MLPRWMASLTRSAAQDKNDGLYPKDKNDGLYPKDKPLYDPRNKCDLQSSSKDSFDANGAKVVVRGSSSEGMWETQDQCCQNLYCEAETCDVYDNSNCSKNANITCPGGRSCDDEPSHHKGKHHQSQPNKKNTCLTIPGEQYCGENCDPSQGRTCWAEEDCTSLDGVGVTGKQYLASFAKCCVKYTALNGMRRQNPEFDEDTTTDDTLARCQQSEEFQNRQTDYPMQEPACAGGYVDRGEFPSPASPSPTVPCPGPPPTAFSNHHHHRHHADTKVAPPPTPKPPVVTRFTPPAKPETHSTPHPPHVEPRQGGKFSPRNRDPFGEHRRVTSGMRGSPTRPGGEMHGPRGR